jgi:hypothetical protein
MGRPCFSALFGLPVTPANPIGGRRSTALRPRRFGGRGLRAGHVPILFTLVICSLSVLSAYQPVNRNPRLCQAVFHGTSFYFLMAVFYPNRTFHAL